MTRHRHVGPHHPRIHEINISRIFAWPAAAHVSPSPRHRRRPCPTYRYHLPPQQARPPRQRRTRRARLLLLQPSSPI